MKLAAKIVNWILVTMTTVLFVKAVTGGDFSTALGAMLFGSGQVLALISLHEKK